MSQLGLRRSHGDVPVGRTSGPVVSDCIQKPSTRLGLGLIHVQGYEGQFPTSPATDGPVPLSGGVGVRTFLSDP